MRCARGPFGRYGMRCCLPGTLSSIRAVLLGSWSVTHDGFDVVRAISLRGCPAVSNMRASVATQDSFRARSVAYAGRVERLGTPAYMPAGEQVVVASPCNDAHPLRGAIRRDILFLQAGCTRAVSGTRHSAAVHACAATLTRAVHCRHGTRPEGDLSLPRWFDPRHAPGRATSGSVFSRVLHRCAVSALYTRTHERRAHESIVLR